MSSAGRTCGTCFYQDDGFCHRFPPQVVAYQPGQGETVMANELRAYPSSWKIAFTRPTVSRDDWCGEFKD